MITFLYVITALFLISLTITMAGIIGERLYIRKMAKKYTYQEINDRINKDIEELNNTNYKGQMLENILDHKEMWERIKEYKRRHF